MNSVKAIHSVPSWKNLKDRDQANIDEHRPLGERLLFVAGVVGMFVLGSKRAPLANLLCSVAEIGLLLQHLIYSIVNR